MPLILGILVSIGCATGTSTTIPEKAAPVATEVSAESTPKGPPPNDTDALPNPTLTASEESPETPGRSGVTGVRRETPPTTPPNEEPKPVPLASLPEPILETERVERKPAPPSVPVKSDQELLDSALEFCQASSDFWDQGDLDNAIAALDKAYSLILQVNTDLSPELAQQRDDLRFTISKRIIEVYASRFTVANGDHKPIPLAMNRHVERALDLFKTKEKTFFLDSYRRSGRYRPYIVNALKEAGLPEELSWLPLIESGFKLRALSRARALGMWQFIASTGYKYGLKRDRWIDERMDPERATDAAIAYLKELHQIFGDWTTALAAYNCGEGAVLKRIRTQRANYLDNFWDLYETLPMETAFYVPKFLAVLHILNDPEKHGFILPPVDEPMETEKVTIDKQIHLKTLAEHLDVPYEQLVEFNPALKRQSTPDKPYAFRLPRGKGPLLMAKLDEIPAWEPPVMDYVLHRVRTGETLSVIARRYGSSVHAIMEYNNLRSKHYIKAGWKLRVPTRRYASRFPVQAAAETPKPSTSPTQYVVHKGDSLWRIAQRFGTTTHAITAANGLTGADLSVGQVLIIPSGVVAVTTINTKEYTVLKGDSPYVIAQKNQMSLSEFLRLNSLTPRSTIFPGQTVLIKAQ